MTNQVGAGEIYGTFPVVFDVRWEMVSGVLTSDHPKGCVTKHIKAANPLESRYLNRPPAGKQ